MFVILQYPLADLRQFVPSETFRLTKPTWPLPRPNQDFVRGFGLLCKRVMGGVESWPGEDYYCEAANAVRLVENWRSVLPSPVQSLGRVHCAFRRLLADGGSVVRVEIAFEIREHDIINQIDDKLLGQVLTGVLDLPVRLSTVAGANQRVRSPQMRLGESGDELARNLLHSTTARPPAKSVKPLRWWIQCCEPMLVVQHLSGQIGKFPKHSRLVDLGKVDLELRYVRHQSRAQRFIPVWLLGITPSTNKDYARRLRLHLLRLHAELESLKQVLRSIVDRRLDLVAGTPACDNLQRYLKSEIALLSRGSRYGIPQSELLRTVLSSQDLVTPGERDTLLFQTETVLRGNVFRSLKRFTEPRVNQYINVSGAESTVQVGAGDQKQENIMNKKSISFGDQTKVIGSNITAADDLRRNTLTANGSDDSRADLPQALDTLQKAVDGMCRQLSDEAVAEVRRDLSQFVAEVSAPKPRAKWYELSANGLKDAASFVGQFAAPVASAVDQVLRLVSKATGQSA